MTVKRIPLVEEPISGTETVEQYDRGARRYMMPEYRYFSRKILGAGIQSGKVLDIGTGTGWLAIQLAAARGTDFAITALDISGDMLSRAKKNARNNGVDSKIKFVRGSASAMPFADRSFDLVISYASLHHWSRPVDVFNEAGRVARETGLIVIRDNLRVYGDLFRNSAIWLASRFMDAQHRKNWRKAILASYTVPEVRGLLDRSQLKGFRVRRDFLLFDLSIEKEKAKSS
jgi:ubiquinone/menaquinone biosynthesis C-methylase UbiE